MGLLSRAGSHVMKKTLLSGRSSAAGQVSLPSEPLDEMGKALRERLGRLPQKTTTPHTALSLLKAYGAFQIGICLSLKDRHYSSYDSVGFGIEKISIPQDAVWSKAKAHDKYFKLNFHTNLKTTNIRKNLVYWGFPLDSSIHSSRAPWEAIMILGIFESSDFRPEPISAILDEVGDKLLPVKAEPDNDEDDIVHSFEQANSGRAAPHHNAVEEKIAQFHQMHLDFNCIVLETPAGKTNFCEKVLSMIDTLGTTVPLAYDRPLILFPIVLDRELIAHRLSKTLKTKILLSFAANTPENALIRIDSLM